MYLWNAWSVCDEIIHTADLTAMWIIKLINQQYFIINQVALCI